MFYTLLHSSPNIPFTKCGDPVLNSHTAGCHMGPSSSGYSEWGHTGLQGIDNLSFSPVLLQNQPKLHHARFIFYIFPEKFWILLFVCRSISGSFSFRMRRSACVRCSCRSSGWSLKTWQVTPPTWSVWQPSMLQGMGPAPCPPEGALSKQVSRNKSRCGWGDYIDCSRSKCNFSCS